MFHPAFPMRLYVSKAKTIASILVGLGVSAFGCYSTWSFLGSPWPWTDIQEVAVRIVLMLAAPSGLFLAGVGVGQLLNRGPGLLIDDEGVTATNAKMGFVPWSEIREAKVTKGRMNGAKIVHLVLVLKDPAALGRLYSGSLLKRHRYSLALFGGLPISLNPYILNVDEFAVVIDEFSRDRIASAQKSVA